MILACAHLLSSKPKRTKTSISAALWVVFWQLRIKTSIWVPRSRNA